MPSEPPDVSGTVGQCRSCDGEAAASLFPLVYHELRALAEGYLRHERPDHTLQPTALVHEAYLKLVDQTQATWQDRAHFVAVAARAMRQILVNHAIAHGTKKRGGGRRKLSIDDSLAAVPDRAADLLALDEALKRLGQVDPQKAELVQLRFFGGLTAEEASEVLGVSLATVERGWRLSRAWLRREISKGDADDA